MSRAAGRLLLVDDDRQTRLKLTRKLEAAGHSVHQAESGPEALKFLAAESFDVVLLDILMPGMDGFEVLEALEADGRMRDVPVIVISALDDAQAETRCTQLGARAYLAKPVDTTVLNTLIIECLDPDTDPAGGQRA